MCAVGRRGRLIPYDEAIAKDLVKLIRREGGLEIVQAFLKDVAVFRGRLQVAQGDERDALLMEGAQRRAAFLTQVAEALASSNEPA